MTLTANDFTIEQLANGNFVAKATGIYQDIDFVNGGFITTKERAQEIVNILVANATPSLADVQNAKIAQIRDSYNQTLASGFNVTIGSTQNTFGWTTDDITHMTATQTAVGRGFLIFPILYVDVTGSPVTVPDQATLDKIEETATKFMTANHQQAIQLVGQVKSATTIDTVNAIQWQSASY
ncbi:hypothetical protein HPT25_23380 [Bacillus sp. BRMEA1]|uniref:hypothetical protein n=1 Tax=Neobacillus endophyticus TaxID=2738405 RepID=UPI001566B34D|nr:hypothetical protein [Neobacillus endophyticus]NRD80268.1 hypothetical protein [Neobacillus endophyticus]